MLLHLAQPRNGRLLPVATLLILTATASVCLWRAQPVRAGSPSGPTLSISSSPGVTLKFSGVPPNAQVMLLGQVGIENIGLPPTTDTRLITVSNTGSGDINLYGLDNTLGSHTLAQVAPGQTVAVSVPSVWFASDLTVINYGLTLGQGVVTIN